MDKYVGKRLDGRYEISELIGVGGMANIYKARDCMDDIIVAIKILKDEYMADEDFRRNFRNECKAIAVLSHPNIVKVLDVNFGDRIQYIVMEYIDGITLKEYITQQGTLNWKDAIHFTVQILRALQHAHDKGIIHRDIKPQNIMLMRDGTIKVTDFGIAYFTRNRRRTETTQKAVGSVHYICPEQARGEIPDERSDLYSVGVMLYEMLTGKVPFESDNAVSVAIMQLQSTPVLPREINDSIPEGLQDIIMKAMQKEPDNRYQSAAEFLQDLYEFKNNPSIHFEYKYFVDDTPTKFVGDVEDIDSDNDDEYYDDEDEDDEDEDGKKKKKLPTVAILGGVAAAFVVIVLIFVGVFALVNRNKKVDIQLPNLVGMNINDAKEQYKDIVITVENSKFDSADADTILSQSPEPPRTIKSKSEVKVVISKGPSMVSIPDVYGKKQEDAKKELENAGLKVELMSSTDESTPKGLVINTLPARNSSVAEGSTIKLNVSLGSVPVPVKVPTVNGINETDAKKQIEEVGLKITESTYVDSDKEKGTVLSSDPAQGTSVESGTTVKLTVSNGNAPSKKVTVSVTLPSYNKGVILKVLKDGVLIDTSKELIPDKMSKAYTVDVEGKAGEKSTVTVQIKAVDGGDFQDLASYEVDFSAGSSKQTNRYTFTPPTNKPQGDTSTETSKKPSDNSEVETSSKEETSKID